MGILSYIFPIVGTIFTALGIRIIIANYRKTNAWILTVGEVVDFKIYDNEGFKFPVIKFTKQDGEERTAAHNQSGFPGYSIGSLVVIYYNPQMPSEILIDTFGNKYGAACFIVALGIVFITMGHIVGPIQYANTGGNPP